MRLFIAGAVLCAGFSACSPIRTVRVDAGANGSRISLHPGDRLVITLEGNITTGYQWVILPNMDGVLELQGEPEYAASTKNLMGAGGVYHFTFKAIKAGTTQLNLKYYRSFEPADVPPIETFTLDVDIQ